MQNISETVKNNKLCVWLNFLEIFPYSFVFVHVFSMSAWKTSHKTETKMLDLERRKVRLREMLREEKSELEVCWFSVLLVF